MRVLAALQRETWRARLSEAAEGIATVTFAPDTEAAQQALARSAPDVVVIEGPETLEAGPPDEDVPEILALLDDPALLERALLAGATDCAVDPEPAELRRRLLVLSTRRARLTPVRAEAAALRMMTSARAGWRYWEFDIRTQALSRALPEGPTERGLATEALRTRGWDALHTARSQALIREAIKQQLDEHRSTGRRDARQLELEMENADGSRGHRLITARLGLDRDGSPNVWRGVTYDITDAVRASASLASVQASFDRLIGILPLPVFTIDARGNVVTWNDASVHTFGFAREEVIGGPLPLFDPGTGVRLDELVAPRQDRDGADSGREMVLSPKAGPPLDVWVWRSAVLGEGGVVEATMFVVADITAKKRTALDYKKLFEAAHDAILVIDPDGEVVLDINTRGCELYGMARHEMIGRSLLPISIDPERGARKIQETLESGSLISFETVQLKKDGTPMHLEVNASCVEYGGRKAILSINRDVTATKAQAEALRRRDLALAEATRLDAVGRLAGGVAHDFNNLLMVIESGVEALASELSAERRASDDLADVEEAVGRARALVTQLLTFANRARTEPKTLSVVDVVRRLTGILRRLVREDIDLQLGLESGLPSVRVDESQLEQVIINLVVNARDAIGGVGTIEVRVRRAERPGLVELIVRDDGHGMDQATRSRIFEPFFTTKGAGRGTGLGLATVHGIVRGFGGEVTVTSSPGAGTQFRVTIPVEAGDQSSVEEAPARRTSRPGAECILLVEDERAVRRILSRQLRRLGYLVLESHDGADALALATQYPDRIDMLITDVVMPNLGGDELAIRLRAERPDMKILFMSGHVEGAQLRAIADRNLGPILAKPFGVAELTEAVRLQLEA